ncbi:glycosyltransferase [Desulfovibrio sp. DS-1]|nr:glycosyltransferase family 2 protein [Nitratidesulfovibrio sp. SRB-5]RXF74894.1 glycosyltransferase [Desulfovibrio sp. DS-1]
MPDAGAPRRVVSLVVPVLNEEDAVPLFLSTVRPIVDREPYDFEFVFVNDGSSDRTVEVLLAEHARDPRVKLVDLSRNFGKELALAAGLQAARGDAVVPMDVDLQDPPEVLPNFLRAWEQGAEVVVGVRRARSSDTVGKRVSARLFYRLFNRVSGSPIVPDAGDYRLLSRPAVDALNALPERVRFTKGLYTWVGFRQVAVHFDRAPRSAGTGKWKPWKLWNFAIDGLTGFSTLPLRMWSYLGMLVALAGFVYAAVIAGRTLLFGAQVPGYASFMVTLLTLGGLVMVSLGIIGEYLGRVYEEVKRRPQYVVRRRVGFHGPDNLPGNLPGNAVCPPTGAAGYCPCCGARLAGHAGPESPSVHSPGISTGHAPGQATGHAPGQATGHPTVPGDGNDRHRA